MCILIKTPIMFSRFCRSVELHYFSTSGGEEVLTHRLVLAAHNEYFYQLLTSTSSVDQDMEVILMPDHSREDVVNMVKQLYNFKVKNSAFLSDENLHEYRITDLITSADMKKNSGVNIFSKNSSKFSSSLSNTP